MFIRLQTARLAIGSQWLIVPSEVTVDNELLSATSYGIKYSHFQIRFCYQLSTRKVRQQRRVMFLQLRGRQQKYGKGEILVQWYAIETTFGDLRLYFLMVVFGH